MVFGKNYILIVLIFFLYLQQTDNTSLGDDNVLDDILKEVEVGAQ